MLINTTNDLIRTINEFKINCSFTTEIGKVIFSISTPCYKFFKRIRTFFYNRKVDNFIYYIDSNLSLSIQKIYERV